MIPETMERIGQETQSVWLRFSSFHYDEKWSITNQAGIKEHSNPGRYRSRVTVGRYFF
jgi:hypothetical protein